jgi:hypothetical protein
MEIIPSSGFLVAIEKTCRAKNNGKINGIPNRLKKNWLKNWLLIVFEEKQKSLARSKTLFRI